MYLVSTKNLLNNRNFLPKQCFLSCINSAPLNRPDNSKASPSKTLSCKPKKPSNSLSCRNLIIGVDPGLSGAIAVIRIGTAPAFVAVFDMPVKKVKGKNRTDLDALCLLVESYAPNIKFVLIEEVGQIRTKADPFSSFVFGFTTGAVHGVFAAHIGAEKIQTIKPNIWKAALGLDANKAKALAKAIKFFPNAAPYLTRKKDHDRAEALLLGHFANSFIKGAA